jgi:uncharacterized membrane protein
MSDTLAPDDRRQLGLLSTFHVVFGLCASAVLILMLFGIALLITELREVPNTDDTAIMWVMIAVYGVVALMLLAVVVLNLMAARRLVAHRGYGLCRVVSVLNMLSAPLGTGLGIWSWLVLSRPSVRAAFGQPG